LKVGSNGNVIAGLFVVWQWAFDLIPVHYFVYTINLPPASFVKKDVVKGIYERVFVTNSCIVGEVGLIVQVLGFLLKKKNQAEKNRPHFDRPKPR